VTESVLKPMRTRH